MLAAVAFPGVLLAEADGAGLGEGFVDAADTDTDTLLAVAAVPHEYFVLFGVMRVPVAAGAENVAHF